MDTVTQITLGAAVGEVILGKKTGNKAPLWGALLGVVPDMDVLFTSFLTDVQEIIVHRGISHSLLFCIAAPPVFGWALSKMKWNREVDWKSWSWMVFWVIFTHIFIDVCTSYGTQVFQPFSNVALSFNSIFIVDPFYTLPLMAGIITALFFQRGSARRALANYLGLGLSSFYLLMGFGIKYHVNEVFEENFRRGHITVDRHMTTPAPFTEFLWTGYAESNDTIYAGIYSIFDDDRSIDLIKISQNSELINPYKNDLPVRRLLWFSNGYYAVDKKPDGIYFHDLRFGRSDLWLTDKDASFVWNYKLQFNADSTKVTGFQHLDPAFNIHNTQNNLFDKLLERIWGENKNEQDLKLIIP